MHDNINLVTAWGSVLLRVAESCIRAWALESGFWGGLSLLIRNGFLGADEGLRF